MFKIFKKKGNSPRKRRVIYKPWGIGVEQVSDEGLIKNKVALDQIAQEAQNHKQRMQRMTPLGVTYDEVLRLNAHLYEMVQRDHLTGLYNMRTLYDKINFELQRRHHQGVACIMLDLDNFKHINDQHDHLFGSYVLQQIGQLLQQSIRATDYAARYGGDEFLIVLTDTPPDGALQFCRRLRKTLNQQIFENYGHKAQVTASFGYATSGVATISSHTQQTRLASNNGQNLVQQADKALYQAKDKGRDCIQAFQHS